MSIVRYWCRALSNAIEHTKHFLRWNKGSAAFLLLYGVGLLIYWQWKGTQAVNDEIAIFIAFGLAPIGAFAVFLLAVNLIKAPYHMEQTLTKENAKKIGKLESEIKDLKDELVYAESQFLSKPAPHLIFHDPYNTQRQLGHLKTPKTVHFVIVPVSNEPQKRDIEARAYNVIAEVEFTYEDGEQIFPPIRGDWTEMDEQSTAMWTQRVDFLANGENHNLYILLKYPEDDYSYAYNRDSHDAEGWRVADRKVVGEAKVYITLKGEGIWTDIVGEFSLSINEDGSPRLSFVRQGWDKLQLPSIPNGD